MTIKPRILPVAAVASVVALGGGAVAVASGGGGAQAHAARVTTLHLSADAHGKPRFNTKHLTARAGTVRIVLRNPKGSGMPHGVTVTGHGVGGSSSIVGPGRTTSVTVRLKRGTYVFFCPVDHHRQLGMKGTLTVR